MVKKKEREKERIIKKIKAYFYGLLNRPKWIKRKHGRDKKERSWSRVTGHARNWDALALCRLLSYFFFFLGGGGGGFQLLDFCVVLRPAAIMALCHAWSNDNHHAPTDFERGIKVCRRRRPHDLVDCLDRSAHTHTRLGMASSLSRPHIHLPDLNNNHHKSGKRWPHHFNS